MDLTKELSVTHSTFVIERSYAATPEKVFAAFADPVKKRHWFVDSKNLEIEHFQMDFRVGGAEISRFRTKEDSPLKGATFGNQTTYLDIVPNRRIVIAYTMAVGDRRISASLATFELVATAQGTDLIFTDQGAFFEGADGPQMRQRGWRTLLEHLAEELAQ
jgi:uncharacterized protein YndB with AHSA1/START domain